MTVRCPAPSRSPSSHARCAHPAIARSGGYPDASPARCSHRPRFQGSLGSARGGGPDPLRTWAGRRRAGTITGRGFAGGWRPLTGGASESVLWGCGSPRGPGDRGGSRVQIGGDSHPVLKSLRGGSSSAASSAPCVSPDVSGLVPPALTARGIPGLFVRGSRTSAAGAGKQPRNARSQCGREARSACYTGRAPGEWRNWQTR